MKGARVAPLLFAAQIALGVSVSPALCGAQGKAPTTEPNAATAFADGQRAFSAGDYRRAADLFEQAYKAKPHYSPLWNAARSWERAGEAARAANAYARYLREAPPNAPDRDGATAALLALGDKLARIEVHPADGVTATVDGAPVEGGMVYVNPGDHVIEGKKGDLQSRKMQNVSSGDVVSVAVDVDVEAHHETFLPEPAKPAHPTPEAAPPAREHHGLSPIFAIGGGILTLAAGGFTVWSGLDTLKQKDAFDQSHTQQNLDDGRSKETRTNIGIVVTSVLGAATVATAIFFTDWGGHENATASRAAPSGPRLRVGVGPGSVAVGGAF